METVELIELLKQAVHVASYDTNTTAELLDYLEDLEDAEVGADLRGWS